MRGDQGSEKHTANSQSFMEWGAISVMIIYVFCVCVFFYESYIMIISFLIKFL